MDMKQKDFHKELDASEVEKVDKGVIKFLASTPTQDHDGDIVEPMGIKTRDFIPFQVVHDQKKLPIGRVIKTEKNQSGFWATVDFDMSDELARKVYNKYVNDYMNDVSIGFEGKEAEPLDEGRYRFKEVEVYEISAVPVGNNPDTRMEEIVKSINVDDYIKEHKRQEQLDITISSKHINHPYEYGKDLTFGDLHELFSKSSFDAEEKVDGYQGWFRVEGDKAYVARNKSEIQKGGLDKDEVLKKDWQGGDSARKAYYKALEDLESASASELDMHKHQFVSCEVLNKHVKNVLTYDYDGLIVHKSGHINQPNTNTFVQDIEKASFVPSIEIDKSVSERFREDLESIMDNDTLDADDPLNKATDTAQTYIKRLVTAFGAHMLDGMHSKLVNEDNQDKYAKLFDKKRQKAIEKSTNMEGGYKYANKLEKEVNTTLEGIVFKHKGKTMKLTGLYGPMNQLINQKEVTIFPGSFKPPHAGHYKALKDNMSDDINIVLISGKSRGNIDAKTSKNIWDVYTKTDYVTAKIVDESPIKALDGVLEDHKGANIRLIKGQKDADDGRFEHLKDKNNVEVVDVEPKIYGLSASDMRQKAQEDPDMLPEMMPNHLTYGDISKVCRYIDKAQHEKPYSGPQDPELMDDFPALEDMSTSEREQWLAIFEDIINEDESNVDEAASAAFSEVNKEIAEKNIQKAVESYQKRLNRTEVSEINMRLADVMDIAVAITRMMSDRPLEKNEVSEIMDMTAELDRAAEKIRSAVRNGPDRGSSSKNVSDDGNENNNYKQKQFKVSEDSRFIDYFTDE